MEDASLVVNNTEVGGEEVPNDDAASMAYAAAEAAAAAEEQEEAMAAALQEAPGYTSAVPEVCRICGKGPQDDGRILCRFVPSPTENTTAPPPSNTIGEFIALHIFCGKTASILPNVNQPDLEILSKAGIKNKHGIGPEVNGALARTRNCIIPNGASSGSLAAGVPPGTKEKTYYLVKEFEAHLHAIRNASSFSAEQYGRLPAPPEPAPLSAMDAAAAMDLYPPAATGQQAQQVIEQATQATTTDSQQPQSYPPPPVEAAAAATLEVSETSHAVAASLPSSSESKTIPVKAGQSFSKEVAWDGKISCGCGGTHFPTGSPKGDASWRSHVMTKRHQKWMEEQGLLGAV